MKFLQEIHDDCQGQHTVEVMILIALLVVALAAALHGFLPPFARGFDGMAKAILGPIP